MARKRINPGQNAQDTSTSKKRKIHNKSDIPDVIINTRNNTLEKCFAIEKELPDFLKDYFLYLKNAVSINTRLAYLSDLRFFFDYLIHEHDHFLVYEKFTDVPLSAFVTLTSRDINLFIGDYCTRYIVETDTAEYLMENHTRALARKKSSISVLFKFLYRDGLLEKNITEGFNPIKMPKPQPDAIKRLEIEEVTAMLRIVETGEGLTDKEKQYWKKTKYRDKAMLVLFTTYGLRVSEMNQLNLSSINYARGEFKIYRKRGKEVNMPLNQSAIRVVKEYIDLERPYCKDEDDPLFLSLQGKRMTVRAIRDLVKKYTSIAMKVPRTKGFSPHKLRATAASSLIQYGFSIYDVQNLLDHDNVTTTQLYAAHRKNAKRDVVSHYELLDEYHDNEDEDNSENNDSNKEYSGEGDYLK